MNRQDDKKAMFDIMPADEDATDKPSLSRRLIYKTLQHAQDAVEFASDTSRNIAGVADAALGALDQVTHHTKRGVEGVRNSVRDMVSETSEAARQVALAMARASLGKGSLTLYLPEMLLNNQIRKRMDRSEIDDIKIECGNDRFHIELDGHYRRFLYRLSLEFNVLECRIGQEKYLRLRQVDEHLDLQTPVRSRC